MLAGALFVVRGHALVDLLPDPGEIRLVDGAVHVPADRALDLRVDDWSGSVGHGELRRFDEVRLNLLQLIGSDEGPPVLVRYRAADFLNGFPPAVDAAGSGGRERVSDLGDLGAAVDLRS